LHFARIQIVLLQNYYVASAGKIDFAFPNEEKYTDFGAMPATSIIKSAVDVFVQSFKALLLLRPGKEWSWFKRRFNY